MIDIQKLSTDQLIYWCPKEVIDCMAAEQKGVEYKYKKPEDFPGHAFWFICTDKYECHIVSGISMQAWCIRNTYEGYLPSASYRPNITPNIAKAVMDFISKSKNK